MSEPDTLRVLVVEDDGEDAEILERHLRRAIDRPIRLRRLAAEEEAWAALINGRFDLVFLDLNLEGPGSGMGLLRRLEKGGVDTPVVVVTGGGDQLRAVEAMKAGAYDYLVKGDLSADLLKRTVRHVLRQHFLERERARILQRLAELSVTDELTSLGNRRLLMKRLDEEAARSGRTGHLFALLLIDLDHFKRVNDEHGHAMGDRVLKECAAVLKKHVRGTDFVARYGGEEFCVLLPDTPRPGALRVAEKLRRAMESAPDPMPTISVGLAVWQADSKAEDVLRQADRGLYAAKERGRNKVVAVRTNGRELTMRQHLQDSVRSTRVTNADSNPRDA
ncbi:MAG: GGDEF domain-containing response regulator [Planctomycetota bacterium]|jgi:diguanylate cyclase (GGDEF)-like protein